MQEPKWHPKLAEKWRKIGTTRGRYLKRCITAKQR